MHQNERVVNALSFFKKYIFHKHEKKVKQHTTACVRIHKSANIFEALPCRQAGSTKLKADE